MKSIFLVFVSAIALASCIEIYYGEDDDSYLLIPIQRQKRETTVGLDSRRMFASHQETLLNRNGHVLQGGAFASKPLPRGPWTAGGNLNYDHVPSGSNLNVGASHTHRFGTDLNADGNLNLWRHGGARLDAQGSYRRHFGGPFGNSRPDYYGGLQFQSRF